MLKISNRFHLLSQNERHTPKFTNKKMMDVPWPHGWTWEVFITICFRKSGHPKICSPSKLSPVFSHWYIIYYIYIHILYIYVSLYHMHHCSTGQFCHGSSFAAGAVYFSTTGWNYCGSWAHFEGAVCSTGRWFKSNKQDTSGAENHGLQAQKDSLGKAFPSGSWSRMFAKKKQINLFNSKNHRLRCTQKWVPNKPHAEVSSSKAVSCHTCAGSQTGGWSKRPGGWWRCWVRRCLVQDDEARPKNTAEAHSRSFSEARSAQPYRTGGIARGPFSSYPPRRGEAHLESSGIWIVQKCAKTRRWQLIFFGIFTPNLGEEYHFINSCFWFP